MAPAALAELVCAIDEGLVSGKIGKQVLPMLLQVKPQAPLHQRPNNNPQPLSHEMLIKASIARLTSSAEFLQGCQMKTALLSHAGGGQRGREGIHGKAGPDTDL